MTGADGAFVRPETQFRDWVTDDRSSPYAVAPGRYHLYVSLACPWAHRTLIARALHRLDDAISLSVVDPFMGDDGWAFSDGPRCIRDPIHGAAYLRDIYRAARADYTGRVTVPVLWDRDRATIVSNESLDVIQMLDGPLAALAAEPTPRLLFPARDRDAILTMIRANYVAVNNGVYRCGFARSQAAYDAAARALFDRLDQLERILGSSRWLCGDRMTAADVCLFTTLIRFDVVYHYHFKCNLRRLIDYSNLWGFTRDVYQTPRVADTVALDHIRGHYYRSHESINPTRIVPIGPALAAADLMTPHGRG